MELRVLTPPFCCTRFSLLCSGVPGFPTMVLVSPWFSRFCRLFPHSMRPQLLLMTSCMRFSADLTLVRLTSHLPHWPAPRLPQLSFSPSRPTVPHLRVNLLNPLPGGTAVLPFLYNWAHSPTFPGLGLILAQPWNTPFPLSTRKAVLAPRDFSSEIRHFGGEEERGSFSPVFTATQQTFLKLLLCIRLPRNLQCG